MQSIITYEDCVASQRTLSTDELQLFVISKWWPTIRHVRLMSALSNFQQYVDQTFNKMQLLQYTNSSQAYKAQTTQLHIIDAWPTEIDLSSRIQYYVDYRINFKCKQARLVTGGQIHNWSCNLHYTRWCSSLEALQYELQMDKHIFTFFVKRKWKWNENESSRQFSKSGPSFIRKQVLWNSTFLRIARNLESPYQRSI